MLKILNNLTICLTRGDVGDISVSAKASDDSAYTFAAGDVLRLKVFKQKACDCVVMQKDVTVTEAAQRVSIPLTSADTMIGDLLHEPMSYWYEVKLNPDTHPQTIIGYDDRGEKVFRLYPGGGDLSE